jgi:hypothetical protein
MAGAGGGILGGLVALISVVWALGVIALHIALALAVSTECARMQRTERQPIMIGSLLWTFAALLTGIIGAGFFWLLHHGAGQDGGTLGATDG